MQDVRNRAKEKLDVGPQRLVRDAEIVDRDDLVEGPAARAENLQMAGDPGRELEPPPVPAHDPLVLRGDQRSWSDQAHLAAHDVQQRAGGSWGRLTTA